MTASPLAPRARPGRCSCRSAPGAWLYLEAPASLPVGVPAGAHVHTSVSPASLNRLRSSGGWRTGRRIAGRDATVPGSLRNQAMGYQVPGLLLCATARNCRCRHPGLPGDQAVARAIVTFRRGAGVVDLKLEVVMLPVADVERAKNFYGQIGWRLDADLHADNGFRVVQFTPPGSGGSIQFGTNVTSAAPGSAQGLYLIVTDIEAARDELAAR